MSGDGRRLSWGWLVLGALALVLGTLLLAAAWQFQRHATPASGVVVGHQGRAGGVRDWRGRYVSTNVVPVVAYRDAGGRIDHVVGGWAADESAVPAVGSAVAVRYRRLADGSALVRIDRPFEIWGIPALLCLFGAGFMGAGLLARHAARDRARLRDRRPPGDQDWLGLRRRAALRATSTRAREGGGAR